MIRNQKCDGAHDDDINKNDIADGDLIPVCLPYFAGNTKMWTLIMSKKKIHSLCEDGIEKSAPQDHCL